MADRPPLAMIVAGADAARLHAALTLCRCEIALGGTAALFLQGAAVALLRPPIAAPQDPAWRAAGEPTLAALVAEALADGVAISLCQSGLALAGLTADDLCAGLHMTGPLAFLAAADARVRLLIV
ncbi:MAG TPA: peroxiredoxin [Sphingobium sp.]|nr:peroxiredoxin [Sphingobium sp.]